MNPQFPPVPQHEIIAVLDFRRKLYILRGAIPKGSPGPALRYCEGDLKNGMLYTNKLLVTIHPSYFDAVLDIPVASNNPILLQKTFVHPSDRNTMYLLYKAIEESVTHFLQVVEQSSVLLHGAYFDAAVAAAGWISNAQLHIQTILTTTEKYPAHAKTVLPFC